MASNGAPRKPRRQVRDLTSPPSSSFFSSIAVFWMILGAAAAYLIWVIATDKPPNAPHANAGASVQTQPATSARPLTK